MVMRIALSTGGWAGVVMIYVIFVFWAALTISILGKIRVCVYSAAEQLTPL